MPFVNANDAVKLANSNKDTNVLIEKHARKRIEDSIAYASNNGFYHALVSIPGFYNQPDIFNRLKAELVALGYQVDIVLVSRMNPPAERGLVSRPSWHISWIHRA